MAHILWNLECFPDWFCLKFQRLHLFQSCQYDQKCIHKHIYTCQYLYHVLYSESLDEYFLYYYDCYFSSVLWDNLIINQPCISIEERVGYESLSPIFFEFKVKNSLHFCGIGYNRNVKNF